MHSENNRKRHHHDPKKFKFGILRYSIASKIANPNDKEEITGQSIQFLDESYPDQQARVARKKR